MRWLFSGTEPPARDAYVVMARHRILAVTKRKPDCPTWEMLDKAALPGLLNCHTHLEWSHLEQPLGERGQEFTAWLERMITRRRSDLQIDAGRWSMRRRQGLAQSLAFGVHWLADVVSVDEPAPTDSTTYRVDDCMGVVPFRELIGLLPLRWPELRALAEKFVRQARLREETVGLSPHAPYTVARAFLAELVAWANQHQLPLAMHVAESWEELELLAGGRGPLVELLESLNAWDRSAWKHGSTPRDVLDVLASAVRVLVIHGNYLTRDDLCFLAGQRSRMSLVYCPRTHDYFAHKPYPLAEALRCGVRVVLGTDSRATNPDLSVFEEMRFVASRYPSVDPADVVRMATVWAAEAMGLSGVGAVQPGMSSALTLVQLDNAATGDPYESLWQGTPCPTNTWQ